MIFITDTRNRKILNKDIKYLIDMYFPCIYIHIYPYIYIPCSYYINDNVMNNYSFGNIRHLINYFQRI